MKGDRDDEWMKDLGPVADGTDHALNRSDLRIAEHDRAALGVRRAVAVCDWVRPHLSTADDGEPPTQPVQHREWDRGRDFGPCVLSRAKVGWRKGLRWMGWRTVTSRF